nr:helix-turn-helix transcriptional regulator [uncultured Blautia sp.]
MKIDKIRLGIAMAEKGYNFTTLASASGVSRTTLSYINNGKQCRVDVLIKMAKALGVEATELLVSGEN